MRILMVSQYYPPWVGGYEAICADTVKLLRDRGHEVRVVTSVDTPVEAEQDGDIRRVLRVRAMRHYESARLARAPGYLADVCVFRANRRTVCAEAKEFGARVAVVWQLNGLGPDLVQGLRRDGVPTVLNVGDKAVYYLKTALVDERAPLWRLARTLFYRGFARDLARTRLAFASEALRDHYIEGGFAPEHLTVIPIAVWERTVATRAPEGGSGTRLLYVGRLDPVKGIEVALRALVLLNEAEPGRFTLDIVGGGPADYEAALRDFARRIGADGAARFLGPIARESLLRHYDEHDISLVPSVWFEGGGITLLEAMSRGLAAVACDRGGPTNAITHGVDGLLAKSGSPESFAAAVKRLADDPELRRTMGERAIAKVREKFTLESTAAKWEAELERAAATKRPQPRVESRK